MTTKKLDVLSIDCDWITNLKQQEELLSFAIPLIYNHTNIKTALTTHGYLILILLTLILTILYI
jgi:hypothetical protein